jgi:hypothetical protein
MKNQKLKQAKLKRLELANKVIKAIASCGRNHLSYGDRVGSLRLDDNWRCWYTDPYSGRDIYTHYRGRWRYFTCGGTLKSLIERLSDYVCKGYPLSVYSLGYRPKWYCDGDVFGYGKDIVKVWEVAKPLLKDVDLIDIEKKVDREIEPCK